MFIRPKQAQWFETYIPRSQTIHALGIMADSGVVELESDNKLACPLATTELHDAVTEFQALWSRHMEILSDIRHEAVPVLKPPDEVAKESLAYLREWCRSAGELLLQQIEQQKRKRNLLLLQEFLEALQDSSDSLPLMDNASEFLYKGVFACNSKHFMEAHICSLVDEFIQGERHDFILVADLPDNKALVEMCYRDESCIHIDIPTGLPAVPSGQRGWVISLLGGIESAMAETTRQLEGLKRDAELAIAIDRMQLLSWYVDHAKELTAEQTYCHVTGWIVEDELEALEQRLRSKGIQLSVRLTPPPAHYNPPVSLILPGWARPFLPFIEMMGTPGINEVNPGLLLPVTVSLLFGYMFPDIGHGLVMAMAVGLLYRRWPQGRFLIPCGISAALFGVVFGEVFGLGGIIEPLWIRPMDNPLLILLPPVFFGVALMLMGLVFNGIEAHWRGEVRNWLLRDAAVLTIYGAAFAGIFITPFLWLAALGTIWFFVGQSGYAARNHFKYFIASLAMLLQSLFELIMNSISFIRVGAFALAHAVLTSALLQIAEGFNDPVGRGVFLVVGHMLIILVEGLVVYVQTTRLVLFEFFSRFLKAEGRILRPLVPR